jgi:hypothetical protein
VHASRVYGTAALVSRRRIRERPRAWPSYVA